ncbi:uncharacterized protein LOC106081366 [Stomoxys calcitrans]|uniref:uncharacterized protein LOC106081366 n=1 Tax=Stomoxys calcitrans TaxID=35570 RepID=UPI0027E23D19|nr:uncharacterized protein LOC106081366 [Stomoxys calcitrans]XP_059226484.1 uncharacterized protein LOC106081366 [Stomoxys calcitrans]XP_059226485.1 uncharacterized protein LOC106081366 [Stomoxys calcitrans]
MARKNISIRFEPYFKRENLGTDDSEYESTLNQSHSDHGRITEESLCTRVPPAYVTQIKSLIETPILQFKRQRIIPDDDISASSCFEEGERAVDIALGADHTRWTNNTRYKTSKTRLISKKSSTIGQNAVDMNDCLESGLSPWPEFPNQWPASVMETTSAMTLYPYYNSKFTTSRKEDQRFRSHYSEIPREYSTEINPANIYNSLYNNFEMPICKQSVTKNTEVSLPDGVAPMPLLAGKPFQCNGILEEDIRRELDPHVAQMLANRPHRKRVNSEYLIKGQRYGVHIKRSGNILVIIKSMCSPSENRSKTDHKLYDNSKTRPTLSLRKQPSNSVIQRLAGKPFICNCILKDEVLRALDPHVANILATRSYRKRVHKVFEIKGRKYRVLVTRGGDLIVKLLTGKIDEQIEKSSKSLKSSNEKTSLNPAKLVEFGALSDVSSDEIEPIVGKQLKSKEFSRGLDQHVAADQLRDVEKSISETATSNPRQRLAGKPFTCKEVLEEEVLRELDQHIVQILATRTYHKRVNKKVEIKGKKYGIHVKRCGDLIIKLFDSTKPAKSAEFDELSDVSSDESEDVIKNSPPLKPNQVSTKNSFEATDIVKEVGHDMELDNAISTANTIETRILEKTPSPSIQRATGNPFACKKVIEKEDLREFERQVVQILPTKTYCKLDASSDKLEGEFKKNPYDKPNQVSTEKSLANNIETGIQVRTSPPSTQRLAGKPFACKEILEEDVLRELDRHVVPMLATRTYDKLVKKRIEIKGRKYGIHVKRCGDLIIRIFDTTQQAKSTLPNVSSDEIEESPPYHVSTNKSFEVLDIVEEKVGHEIVNTNVNTVSTANNVESRIREKTLPPPIQCLAGKPFACKEILDEEVLRELDPHVVHILATRKYRKLVNKRVQINGRKYGIHVKRCGDLIIRLFDATQGANSTLSDVSSDETDKSLPVKLNQISTQKSIENILKKEVGFEMEQEITINALSAVSNIETGSQIRTPPLPIQRLAGKPFACKEILEEDVLRELERHVVPMLANKTYGKLIKKRIEIKGKKYGIHVKRCGDLIIRLFDSTQQAKSTVSNASSDESGEEIKKSSHVKPNQVLTKKSSESIDIVKGKIGHEMLLDVNIDAISAANNIEERIPERAPPPPMQCIAGKPFACTEVLEEEVLHELDQHVVHILSNRNYRKLVNKRFEIKGRKYGIHVKRCGDLIIKLYNAAKKAKDAELGALTESSDESEDENMTSLSVQSKHLLAEKHQNVEKS